MNYHYRRSRPFPRKSKVHNLPVQEQQPIAQNIEQLGQTNVIQTDSNIHTISIIGQIEGHLVLPPQNKTTKYEHIIPQLVAIEQNPKIEGLLVVLNTVGGDVEAGLAIAELIETLSKPKVSLVLGGGHSIGVPVAVSADYSFISETATMTIHPIRLTGLVIGVPQTYEYLDKMQDRVIRFVTKHSEITEEKYRELMFSTGQLARDIGTVLVGKDAVDVGLISEVGGLGRAVTVLKQLVAQRRNGGEHKLIYYTVLPLELVFEGYDNFSPEYFALDFGRGQVIVEPVSTTTGRIVRLISHDPQDYLDPRFQPGTLIELLPPHWD